MWKYLVSGYFSFSKKDRTGILVLFSVIIFVLFVPVLYPYIIKQKSYDHSAFEKAIAALQVKQADSSVKFKKRDYEKPDYADQYPSSNQYHPDQGLKGELFYFDPNTASLSDWKRLGVREKTIATIRNYVSKGGKFYKKEDISKIWGLHENEVQRLLPYVQILAGAPGEPMETKYEKKEYKKPVYTSAIPDVNFADTAAFIALPGIGSKLSQRIINFRDKLGGFYRVDQIGETFGLPDSTFQKIKPYLKIGNAELKRININTATVDEMKSHPYLRYALANAILQYRTQHGSYLAVADIKKIMTVTDEVFNKVSPYLTVN